MYNEPSGQVTTVPDREVYEREDMSKFRYETRREVRNKASKTCILDSVAFVVLSFIRLLNAKKLTYFLIDNKTLLLHIIGKNFQLTHVP